MLPVALALLITAVNPTYISPLYHQSAGQILLALAAAMVIAGSVAIQKIIDIKV